MSKVISTRIPKVLVESFTKIEDKDDFIKTLLMKSKGRCPFCKNAWPESIDDSRGQVSFRVDDKIREKLDKMHSYSSMLASLMSVHFGICPICTQELKK